MDEENRSGGKIESRPGENKPKDIKTTYSADMSGILVDNSESNSRKIIYIAGQIGSNAEETRFMAGEAASMVREDKPTNGEATSKYKEARSRAGETTPKVKEARSRAGETTPKVKEARSRAGETTPKVKEAISRAGETPKVKVDRARAGETEYGAENKSPITSHILDTTLGLPGSGIDTTLYISSGGNDWTMVDSCTTDADGRCSYRWGRAMSAGEHRIAFQTDAYFNKTGISTFLTDIEITFLTEEGVDHYHIPLLISPFGYTSYKGNISSAFLLRATWWLCAVVTMGVILHTK